MDSDLWSHIETALGLVVETDKVFFINKKCWFMMKRDVSSCIYYLGESNLYILKMDPVIWCEIGTIDEDTV